VEVNGAALRVDNTGEILDGWPHFREGKAKKIACLK
jgi:hypothetical protein